jgi:high-affinity iron transporter
MEAALIVGILLAYVTSIGRKDRAASIWGGTAAAVGVSIGVAAVLFFTASEFEGRAEEIFEGFASLTAVTVLTWMILWMRKQAVGLRGSLQSRVDVAMQEPNRFALPSIAFVVVVREGIETALFAFATVRQAGVGQATIGGVLGLATAIVLGVAIYKGGVRLNLSKFFTWTGVFLLVVAAGLAAHGIHELVEAGLIPAGVEHIWDASGVLPDEAGLGAFLRQMFGYNANPALTEFLVWVTYLLVIGFLFIRPLIRAPRTAVRLENA